ncbi:MAG: ATP-binding cassette domain-containing protein [Mycobacteriales bacterium]
MRAAASDTSAVTTDGLTKRYADRVVVDHLDLAIPAGVVAGIVGPNGAGKTTTMRMLLGVTRPSSGAGTVLGEDIRRPIAYLPRVGALIESPAFYPGLSAARNLLLQTTLGGHDPARIAVVLDRVGLGDRAGRVKLRPGWSRSGPGSRRRRRACLSRSRARGVRWAAACPGMPLLPRDVFEDGSERQ